MSSKRVLLRGGTVYDGNGTPGMVQDVLIVGERIEAVGPLGDVPDADMIDVGGCCVSPGFIDPHNHADNEVEGGILAHPLADNLVRQGITTIDAPVSARPHTSTFTAGSPSCSRR